VIKPALGCGSDKFVDALGGGGNLFEVGGMPCQDVLVYRSAVHKHLNSPGLIFAT
jgi:hypothetical protein